MSDPLTDWLDANEMLEKFQAAFGVPATRLRVLKGDRAYQKLRGIFPNAVEEPVPGSACYVDILISQADLDAARPK